MGGVKKGFSPHPRGLASHGVWGASEDEVSTPHGPPQMRTGRDGRAAEGACLESRCGGNSTGGSNPSLSVDALFPERLRRESLITCASGCLRGGSHITYRIMSREANKSLSPYTVINVRCPRWTDRASPIGLRAGRRTRTVKRSCAKRADKNNSLPTGSMNRCGIHQQIPLAVYVW